MESVNGYVLRLVTLIHSVMADELMVLGMSQAATSLPIVGFLAAVLAAVPYST